MNQNKRNLNKRNKMRNEMKQTKQKNQFFSGITNYGLIFY